MTKVSTQSSVTGVACCKPASPRIHLSQQYQHYLQYLQHADQYLSTQENIFKGVESKSALVSSSLQSGPNVWRLFLRLSLMQCASFKFSLSLQRKETEFAVSSGKTQSRICANSLAQMHQKVLLRSSSATAGLGGFFSQEFTSSHCIL